MAAPTQHLLPAPKGLPRTAESGAAAAAAPRSGSSKRAAEIAQQLGLIGMNELSCGEGERKVKQREAEGCDVGESREDGEEEKGATSTNWFSVSFNLADTAVKARLWFSYTVLVSWELGNSLSMLSVSADRRIWKQEEGA